LLLLARIFSTFLLLVASGSLGSQARAQSFPNRTITLNVGFAAGAPQDLVVRAIAEIASKDLGQPILIDNKPGAAATLAAAVTMTAKPDGYTLATAVSTLVLVPQMQKVAFDPFKDVTFIQQLAAFPVGVTMKADSPFKSWSDLMLIVRADEPGWRERLCTGTAIGPAFADWITAEAYKGRTN
jgi:tripartite-type tricarboxylate transporter receptor subunit TctC